MSERGGQGARDERRAARHTGKAPSLERKGNGFTPRGSRRSTAQDTSTVTQGCPCWNSALRNDKIIHLCCFNPPACSDWL